MVEGASVTTASNVERGKADGSVTSGSLDDLYSGGLSSSVSGKKVMSLLVPANPCPRQNLNNDEVSSTSS